ncbi:MAG: folate family ECF transporter S component [Clostridia bacterium]|nr:folate family ECF transporter S component [Clostridia bacterium]
MDDQKRKFRVIFSDAVYSMSLSLKIAYIAMITAFSIVVNLFVRFPLGDTQISLKIFISIMSGILLGGGSGFVVCMTSDFLGWLMNPGGAYMPWIGLSAGLLALFSGIVMNNFKTGNRFLFYIKCFVVCLFSLTVCTVGINTTALYFAYAKDVSYIDYVFIRLSTQIINSLVNYALVFAFLPVLSEAKPLKKFFL